MGESHTCFPASGDNAGLQVRRQNVCACRQDHLHGIGGRAASVAAVPEASEETLPFLSLGVGAAVGGILNGEKIENNDTKLDNHN